MLLNLKDGKLSWGSIYKLFVVGWATSWTSFSGLIFLIIFVLALITGETTMNGEVVGGRMAAILAIAPMLVIFPIIIFFQALMFSAFLTGGVWLYNRFRPINVQMSEDIAGKFG